MLTNLHGVKRHEKKNGGQSNFGALIQTDAKDSKFTKLFPCQYLALFPQYLDESNSIQFT